ncbi:MAG: hypothetical protein JWP81_4059 [Ferruginibacter sp.]|nr:hypothetical protein [Ferruginibacter sp.]
MHYKIYMNNTIVLGADIGGSHITSALVDLNNRSILWNSYQRQRVNSKGTIDEIVTAWLRSIKGSFESGHMGLKRVGIAMPGPFDYDKGISFIKNGDKYEALYGMNVKEMIFERLGIAAEDICMSNDAACFLQGEVFAGAAKGYESAIGITLGTGLGTARYCHGKSEDVNLWCHPFRSSIAEEYLSTRWFVQRYFQLSGIRVTGVKKIADICDIDKHAKTVFEEFAETFAEFLIQFIYIDRPDVIILGGNISQASVLFLTSLNFHLKKSGFDIPVKIAALGEHAAILGAGSLLTG